MNVNVCRKCCALFNGNKCPKCEGVDYIPNVPEHNARNIAIDELFQNSLNEVHFYGYVDTQLIKDARVA